MLEEKERKRKEREASILNSLSSQEVPAYKIEVNWFVCLFLFFVFL